MDLDLGELPPSFASRLELSLAINVRSHSCNSWVFSVMPVNFDAFSYSTSSMFNVVLMHIGMHDMYASARQFTLTFRITETG